MGNIDAVAARRDGAEPFDTNDLTWPTEGKAPAEFVGENRVLSNAVLPRRNAVSLYAQDRHKRVARAVGYALTAGNPELWGGLALILVARLTPLEAASLAYAALRALEPDAREQVFHAAHWGEVRG